MSDFHDTPLRPYVITGGRAIPTRNTLGVDTLLMAAPGVRPLPVTASRQERALLELCDGLLTVAEAADRLGLPISTTKVLTSDLVDSGHLQVRSPEKPSLELLQEVLDGLRNLL